MPLETRHLTVTVDGEERDGTWKEGVGIYVEGFDFGKGDTVLIEGAPHEVVEMRRMQLEGEAVVSVVGAVWRGPQTTRVSGKVGVRWNILAVSLVIAPCS